jgi:hypothetical protein
MAINTIVALAGCTYGVDNYESRPSATNTLDVANITVETASTAEVSGSVFRVKTNGTTDFGCSYDSTGSDNQNTSTSITIEDTITALAEREAVVFNISSYMHITSAKMRVRKFGGPGGEMTIGINNVTVGLPGSTVLSAASGVALAGFDGGSFEGGLATFNLTTPLSVQNGESVAMVLQPGVGASFPLNNYYGLNSTDDVSGTACSAFSLYKKSTDSGTSWTNGTNAGHRRGFATLTVDLHHNAGTGYWVVQGAAEVLWDMPTFTVSESPNTAGGIITYDIGSSETTTPVFTHAGLTQTQVRALTEIRGAYLFIRVNLSVATPFYERAEIGNGSITTVAH